MKLKLLLNRFFLVMLMFSPILTFAINWKESSNTFTQRNYAAVMPLKFRSVTVDYSQLKNTLSLAPISDFNNPTKQMGLVLSLPLPEGGFEEFRIIETPMMEPDLALKYPNIKTYTGISLVNPMRSVKIDVGSLGFHALIFSENGRIFIDPVSSKHQNNYFVFYAKDMPSDQQPSFECGTIADDAFLKENQNRLDEYYQNRSAIEIVYRTYRMAIACTVEYAQASTGLSNPTKADVLARMVTTINRVNGLYERENAVHFNIIAKTDTLIFLTGTDPYTNESGSTMLGENQATVNARIGNLNYDIGHAFSTGPGGIASLASVCVTGRKAQGVTGLPNPIGDVFDLDFLSHELGHQFSANHTFNSVTGGCAGNRNGSTAYEPGGGTTIMGYTTQCGADQITTVPDRLFHASALDEMFAFMYTSSGNSCPIKVPTGNFQPIVNAGLDYKIPLSTPFQLTGSAYDPDGDSLLFNWEEMDLGPEGGPNNPVGNAPTFRVFPPVKNTTRIFPRLSNIITNTQTKGEKMPSYPRNMRMRLLARDNKPMAGSFGFDDMNIEVVSNAGPFTVSSFNYNDTLYAGSLQELKWDVANTTASPLNCQKVSLLFSTDNGLTFPFTLKDSASNNGFENILMPNVTTNLGRIKVQAVGNIFLDINNAPIVIVNNNKPNYQLQLKSYLATYCASDTIQLMVTAKSFNSFNAPIYLTLNALPTGATAGSFTKNPITPGDTSYVKIATQGIAVGLKTIKINSTADTISHANLFPFNIAPKITALATLVAPAAFQVNVNPNAGFSWNTVTGAKSYQLQVANDTTFNNIALDTIVIGGMAGNFTAKNLPSYKKLFWRVKAINECGQGPFSAICVFYTNGLPAAPTGLKKLSNAGTSLTIRWNDNALNESSYKIERSDSLNLKYVQVASLSADAKQYVSNNLEIGKLYYFRVRCANAVGFSDYSNEILVGLNVGINGEKPKATLSVYPNPANDLLQVAFLTESAKEINLQIIDPIGRVVYQSQETGEFNNYLKAIDVRALPIGVYQVILRTEQNQWQAKFVK